MAVTKQKILIVDDDESFLFILKKEFTTEGFSVVTAKDGKECLDIVGKERPALIVSDILLPGLDGVEMVKKLKEQKIDVPIIFLSNVTDADYLESIKALGVTDYLVKANVQISEIIAKTKNKLGLN